jgi:GDP/UDP-N,N'-diacetylbacillosamine 2-epimerase (hydrolysing)
MDLALGHRVRRVLGITGIRSEYFLQRPIFRAITDHPGLELEVVVTGAHLTPLHGYTVEAVEADGFPIAARIANLVDSDRDVGRLQGAAAQLQALVQVVDERRPDWLLATGDREEALTLAICGAYLNLAVAHYSAGDRVVGNVDDTVRHAVSRLAHLLLTTNEDARRRLIRAGEQEWRVHTVGHAGIDRLRSAPRLEAEELARALGVGSVAQQYVVVVQHPLSSQAEQAAEHMRETLEAVVALGLPAFVSYPNSDPGSRGMIAVIDEYNARDGIHVFENIDDVPFVNLLRGASLLIGNSSLGVLEAPFLRLAAINVGRRQAARVHAENLFFVDADRGAILAQARALLEDEALRERVRTCSNPFGDGHAGERVAELLVTLPRDTHLLDKDLSY